MNGSRFPSPEHISIASHSDPLLLYCPDRCTWVVGIWTRAGWISRAERVRLTPSHWLPLAPNVMEVPEPSTAI
jgi:hypothetical protein